MAVKKFALKKDATKAADGTENEEHIMDIINEIEMLFENIQGNNDIAVAVYNVRKKDEIDEDTLDAIQISCENSIEIEKEAADIYNTILQVKGNIEKYNKANELDFKAMLKAMKELENKSRKSMESVVKN